ncbi:ferredoxin [Streptomyces sp. NPDC059695]|uniref:ferredoxin n=1 Tax=Streptomyces sp. NPDC059695 TaxID=3346910 RepID=UPI00367417A0
MRVLADSGRCIGAGQCVLTAPEVFDQDEDGLVVLLTESVTTEADEKLVREAEHLCPAAALRVTAGPDDVEGQPGA